MPPYALAGLAVVILLSVLASATDHVAGAHLALAYLFLCVVALDRYDARENEGISPLLSLQIGLFFASVRCSSGWSAVGSDCGRSNSPPCS